jgi:hypothetical protein
MMLGGVMALGDLGAPDNPVAYAEATLMRWAPRLGLSRTALRRELKASPLWSLAASESRWRARTRQAHRGQETARTLAVSAGALALALGILFSKPWASPLLAAGLLVWTGLYALDLVEARRFLGQTPWLFAVGQGLNLLFLLGLWAWLRRDDRRV